MRKASNWTLFMFFGASLMLLLLLATGARAVVTYEIGIPMSIADTKRDQLLVAANHAVQVAFNESLQAVGAELRITYRVIPRFSVSDPLSHVTFTRQLLTPNLIAAFDATRGDPRLPSYILANASVPYLTFDSAILSTNPTSINMEFSQIWSSLTKNALLSLGITRVGMVASPSFDSLAVGFATAAAQASIDVVYQFRTQVIYDDLRFRLSRARDAGVVYLVVFGSASDLFDVLNVAAKEHFFFEYIWVACGRSAIAENDFNELYLLNKLDPKYFSGMVSIMLPTSSSVRDLLINLQQAAPNLFQVSKRRASEAYSDVDERVVILHDYVRMVGCTIAKMMNASLDPFTATGPLPSVAGDYPFLPFLLNVSKTFVGATGRFTFNEQLSRNGLMGVFNWRFRDNTTSWSQIGSFSNGAYQWATSTTKDNICWSSSTAAALPNTWVQPRQSESRMVKLGMMFLSATYPYQNEQWLAAGRWAVDLANKEILSYYQLSFEHLDFGGSASSTVAATRKYLDLQSPDVFVGPLTTAHVTSLMPLMQETGIPLVSPYAPGEALSNPLLFKGFARVMHSDQNWALALFSFLRSMNWTTFATISSADEAKAIDEVQYSLPSDFRMKSRSTFDYFNATVYNVESIQNALKHAKQSRARVIVLRTLSRSIPLVLSMAKEMGMFGVGKSYIWVFGTEARVLPLTRDGAAKGELGLLTPTDFTGTFSIASQNAPIANHSAMYRRLINYLSALGLPDKGIDDSAEWNPEYLTIYWVDAILGIAHAIEALYKQNGPVAHNHGPLILEHLLNVAFEGASGLVDLNGYGSRLNLTQVGYNWNGTHWVTSFTYSNSTGEGKLVTDPSNLVWSDGKSVVPLDRFGLPHSSGVGLAIVLITALFQLIFLGTISVVIRYKKHKLIFSSSPMFLSLILVGLALAASTNYAWLGDSWMGSCVTQKFFFYIGFAIAFGALLIKNWRIYALFNDSSMHVIAITNLRLLAYMGVIVSAFGILLTLWAAIDAPMPSPAQMSGFWCAPRSATPAWDIVINGLAIGGLLGGVVLAFMTRNMPAIYNEGKYIGFATYNLVITLMGGLVLAYFIQNSAGVDAGIVVASFAIILSCGGVYAFIFIPKLYMMFLEPEKVSQLWEERTRVTPGGTSRTATGGSAGRTFSSSKGNSREMSYISKKSENAPSSMKSKSANSVNSVGALPDVNDSSESSSTSTSQQQQQKQP